MSASGLGGGVIVDGRLSRLMADFDDFCGTPPPHHKPIPPLPWLRDVLAGVAVAHLVNTLEASPVRAQLQKLSVELVKTGIERAGSNPMPGVVAEAGR
jgi:hypothetical protein